MPATAAGEAAAEDPPPPGVAHPPGAGPGRRAARRRRRRSAAGSSGGTTIPAPDASRIRGTSVPASMAATIGRPAARIEYVFDGTLTRARPRRSGTACTSPVASSSPSRSSGTKPAKRTFGRPAARRSRLGPAAPSPLMSTVTSGSRRAASSSRSSDCENPTLPAYSSDRLGADAELGAVRASSARRAGCGRCRRSWGSCARLPPVGRDLGRDVRRGGRRTAPSRRRRGGSSTARARPATAITQRLVMAPVSTAASGKTSWTLNTCGARCDQATSRPVSAHRQRRRHGDHGVRPAQPATGAEPGPGRRARRTRRSRRRARARLRLSAPGNGWTRRIEPHARRLAARSVDRPTPARWRGPRYHGRAATTCSSWPRAGQLLDEAGEDAAGRGGVRLEVRAETTSRSGRLVMSPAHVRYASARRAPDALVVNSVARCSTGGDELVAARGDVVEGALPGVGIEGPHEGGVAGDLRQGGAVAADAPACRAPSPRGRAPRSPRTPTGTRAPRRRRSGRRGRRRTPVPAARPVPPRPSRADRGHDLVLDQAAPAEQDERQVGVVPRSGEEVEQEAVVLVRMGERRVDDVAPGADAVALRGALGRRRSRWPARRRRGGRRRRGRDRGRRRR